MGKPKFGDKSTGRTSIERLIVWLEAYKLLNPFITISILIVLIGWNTSVHADYVKGFIFLVLVSLILISGTKSAESFFGSSTLAVFIILHLALYGFNSIPLVISFVVFVVFKERFESNLLYPISAYLIFDSIFSYFNFNSIVNIYIEKVSKSIFSSDFFIFLLVIPATYLYLRVEKMINKKFNSSFMSKYGVLVILCILFYLLIAAGFLLPNQILIYLSAVILFLYFIGVMHLKKNIKYSFIASIPILLLILAVFLYKRLL